VATCGNAAPLKRPRGKPPSVGIGKMQAPPTQLRAQDAILFDQVLERVRLLAIQPAIKTANQIWSADMSITTRVGQDLAISGKHFQSA
jgi:hypothetical protein